jgi:uncharacterized protein YaaR (DUF327 family)
MEKIDRFGDAPYFGKPERKKNRKSSKAVPREFRSILNPFVEKSEADFDFDDENDGKEQLAELLDDVYGEGEKLKTSPTFDRIRSYKKSVKRFMDFIVHHSVKVEEKVSGANILKRKKFTLIELIDKKLEDLAAEVLRSQKDQVAILKRVDEINGLLVDLMQ